MIMIAQSIPLLNCRKSSNMSTTTSILALGRSEFGNPANKGNLPTLEQAHALLTEWVPNDRLRLHMKQVAAVMKAWALEREGADEKTALKWELAGLLHDADWEKHPESHCRVIIEHLESLNVDPEVIHCIASHGPRHFGVEPENTMDRMIYVFDELSGFIHAAALIRPEERNHGQGKQQQQPRPTLHFFPPSFKRSLVEVIDYYAIIRPCLSA